MSAPTVVLVHGAWHGAGCWDGVVTELQQLGLAGIAVDLPLAGLAADVAAARSAIEAAGPGCVVVGHSYGGVVISHAAAGLPVARLVYLAAFLIEPGEDMLAMLAGSKLVESLVVGEAGISVDPAAAPAIFYGDADADTAATMVAGLRPMAIDASEPPATEPAWRSIPATYVICNNDQALPVEAQRVMAARAQDVHEWPTDHSPFVTRPRAVAELVAGYVVKSD
jgi:pimeloyl-ACP methyl ester carboxylesterase